MDRQTAVSWLRLSWNYSLGDSSSHRHLTDLLLISYPLVIESGTGGFSYCVMRLEQNALDEEEEERMQFI